MYRILIVEDDAVIAAAMRKHIESWGYTVSCAEDFQNIMGEFAAFAPQLVLLDISLPLFNGYHWCGEMRKVSSAPVIFISSAADNMSIVMAVNMGGDDFIAKPFDLNVLMAKIKAMLRRTYDFAGQTNLLEHRGAIFNTNDITLTYRGERLELTKNESRIIQVLLEHKGMAVSRETIMERLWSTDSFIDDNTLTVNVTRLRKKLEDVGLTEFIKTKKGIGYLVE